MRSAQAYKAIKSLLLCSLLITHTPLKPFLEKALDITFFPSYAIACCASFCIGAAVCALIHKHCSDLPIIVPKEHPSDTIKINKQLVTSLNNLATALVDIHTIKKDKKNRTDELHKKINSLEKDIESIIHVTKITQEKKSHLRAELHTFCEKNNNMVPLVLTLYWLHYRQEPLKIKERTTTPSTIQIDLPTGTNV